MALGGNMPALARKSIRIYWRRVMPRFAYNLFLVCLSCLAFLGRAYLWEIHRNSMVSLLIKRNRTFGLEKAYVGEISLVFKRRQI